MSYNESRVAKLGCERGRENVRREVREVAALEQWHKGSYMNTDRRMGGFIICMPINIPIKKTIYLQFIILSKCLFEWP